MKKILVTGGAGFVGRHLIHSLLQQGDEVHCVDNIVPLCGGIDPARGWPFYNPLDYKNFHYYHEDCRVYFATHDDRDFDISFHLAAVVGGRQIIENNPLAVAEDLSIDSAFWQWALRTKPRKNVCFSSSAVYPIRLQTRDNYVLLEESMVDLSMSNLAIDIGMPDLVYGWAKLTNEYLARIAFIKYGLKSIIYRPFSGYGEDQDRSYPFPSICERSLARKKELVVWGTGDQKRDFIHIDDCIRGILSTMDAFDQGEALNLSTGILTSFKEFARIAAKACGTNPKIKGMSDKPEGVFARGGDTKKQLVLGFRPEISFQEGVERGLQFLEKKK